MAASVLRRHSRGFVSKKSTIVIKPESSGSSGPIGWMLREIAAPDSAMVRVNLALQWIRQDFAQPIDVERLAERASMSVSAFHRHFKAVTNLSPLQYQKRVRLLQARTLMVANAKSVMAAAFEVGYESATQFSRDYAKVFGLPPSQEANRIFSQARGMRCD